MSITVSTFYRFVTLDDCAGLREQLFELCAAHAIKGTILLAPEGINATISGAGADIRAVLAWLRAGPHFAGLVSKESFAELHPFGKLKVKVKPEIVTFGVSGADPSQRAGTYVTSQDWNTLIEDPAVLVLDTRNQYEAGIGTFEGAINPGTRFFSEFPDFVRANLDPARHTRIAMFCTGGIRCEKASAYLLGAGFPEVYHLAGGILKYLETVPPEQSLWRGECFVFDERVALEHGVRTGTYGLCPACGAPVGRDVTAPQTPGWQKLGRQSCPRCAMSLAP